MPRVLAHRRRRVPNGPLIRRTAFIEAAFLREHDDEPRVGRYDVEMIDIRPATRPMQQAEYHAEAGDRTCAHDDTAAAAHGAFSATARVAAHYLLPNVGAARDADAASSCFSSQQSSGAAMRDSIFELTAAAVQLIRPADATMSH